MLKIEEELYKVIISLNADQGDNIFVWDGDLVKPVTSIRKL